MRNKLKREPGFYWVKRHSEWIVAEWYDGWALFGVEADYYDSDFDEIDERRIEREDVQKITK